MVNKDKAIELIEKAFDDSVTLKHAKIRSLNALNEIYGDCIAPQMNKDQIDSVEEIRN